MGLCSHPPLGKATIDHNGYPPNTIYLDKPCSGGVFESTKEKIDMKNVRSAYYYYYYYDGVT